MDQKEFNSMADLADAWMKWSSSDDVDTQAALNEAGDVVRCLLADVRRLEYIIRDSRFEIRPAADPDCHYCGGSGSDHRGRNCDCFDAFNLAKKRIAEEAAETERERVRFEKDHGHGKDEGCKADCPVEF